MRPDARPSSTQLPDPGHAEWEGEQGRTYGALHNKDVLLYRSPAWDSTSSGGAAISSREAASSALATPVLFLLAQRLLRFVRSSQGHNIPNENGPMTANGIRSTNFSWDPVFEEAHGGRRGRGGSDQASRPLEQRYDISGLPSLARKFMRKMAVFREGEAFSSLRAGVETVVSSGKRSFTVRVNSVDSPGTSA